MRVHTDLATLCVCLIDNYTMRIPNRCAHIHKAIRNTFDEYLHSFEIKEINNELLLIYFNKLNYFKTHKIQKLYEASFIVIENIDMRYSLNVNI